MARKRKGNPINGWINLDKPQGLTSTQAIGKIRRILTPQKIGHAGTLDPLATGVLPIAMGEATKTIPFMQDALKTYTFTITWGEQRDTDDSEGEVIATSEHIPSKEDIAAALPRYIGDIEQIPPQYSAVKIDGARAYDLARAGEEFTITPRTVTIETLTLLDTQDKTASFRMKCGKGTYVRALARDLARDLGTCGYISVLRREEVGSFTEKTAIFLDILETMEHSAALNTAVLPLESALDDIPALSVREKEAALLRNGQALSFISRPDFLRLQEAGLGHSEDEDGETALALLQNTPVALVRINKATVKPVRVFNL